MYGVVPWWKWQWRHMHNTTDTQHQQNHCCCIQNNLPCTDAYNVFDCGNQLFQLFQYLNKGE